MSLFTGMVSSLRAPHIIDKRRRSFDSSPTSIRHVLNTRPATPTHNVVNRTNLGHTSPTTVALKSRVSPSPVPSEADSTGDLPSHADIGLRDNSVLINNSPKEDPIVDAKDEKDDDEEYECDSPMPIFVDDSGRDIFAVRTPSSILFGEQRDTAYHSDGVEDDDIDHEACSREHRSKKLPNNWRICSIFTGQIVEDLPANCHRPQSCRGRSFLNGTKKHESTKFIGQGRRGRREPKVVNGRVLLSKREWNAYNSFYHLFLNSNNENEDPTMPLHKYKRYMADIKKDHEEKKRQQTRGWRKNEPTIKPSAEEEARLLKKLQSTPFGSNRSFTEESSTDAGGDAKAKGLETFGKSGFCESFAEGARSSSFEYSGKPGKQMHFRMQNWKKQNSEQIMSGPWRAVGGLPPLYQSQHWQGETFSNTFEMSVIPDNSEKFFNNSANPNHRIIQNAMQALPQMHSLPYNHNNFCSAPWRFYK